MSSTLFTKLVLIAAVIAGFYFFGETLRPLQSSLQHEFDTWLSGEQENLKSAARFARDKAEIAASGTETKATAVNLPTLEARIRQPGSAILGSGNLGSGSEEVFRVAPNADPSRPQQLLRLLDLMKVAGVFDASRGMQAQIDGEPVLHLKVEGPDRTFESVLSASDVEGNITLLLLLKLFKEFSSQQPAASAAASLGMSSAAPEIVSSATSSSQASAEPVP